MYGGTNTADWIGNCFPVGLVLHGVCNGTEEILALFMYKQRECLLCSFKEKKRNNNLKEK